MNLILFIFAIGQFNLFHFLSRMYSIIVMNSTKTLETVYNKAQKSTKRFFSQFVHKTKYQIEMFQNFKFLKIIIKQINVNGYIKMYKFCYVNCRFDVKNLFFFCKIMLIIWLLCAFDQSYFPWYALKWFYQY